MAEHIERLAARKTTNFLANHKCLDCALQLAQEYKRQRCLTCQTRRDQEKREQQNARRRTHRERKVHAAFVGHTQGYPLPG
jgi:hypothetical protein